MLRTILAAATAIPLLLGLGGAPAAAQDGTPEPPRNRLSPTDDSELPQRTVPPLAPPQPLVPRRINEPLLTEPAPPPKTTTTPAKPERTTTPRIVTKQVKPQRVTAKPVATRKAAQRPVIAAKPPQQDDTSLGALFTSRTPPGASPEAPPRTLTYNYFATPPAPAHATAPGAAVPPDHDGAPCPARSGTSMSALFACTR